jgi:hypothetical protein
MLFIKRMNKKKNKNPFAYGVIIGLTTGNHGKVFDSPIEDGGHLIMSGDKI